MVARARLFAVVIVAAVAVGGIGGCANQPGPSGGVSTSPSASSALSSQTASSTPTATTSASPEPTEAAASPADVVTAECAKAFGPLVVALNGMDTFLGTERTQSAYEAKVKAVGSVYDRVFASIPDTSQMSVDEAEGWLACLRLVGQPAEDTYNEYVKANEAWVADSTDDATIQGHWTTASTTLASLNEMLPNLPTPAAQVVKFSGTSSKKTKKFALDGGDYAVVFSGRSTDSYGGNASITLYDGGGNYVDLWVNEIVDGRGNWKFDTNANAVDPGTYYLDVEAPSGRWSVVITGQP